MPPTRDGFHWTHGQVTRGLETDAVVSSSAIVRDEYDVIVIGAGFTGLVAARELCQTYGLRVLIVEGRDRIGGRAWTAKVDGEDFEMGGNWVHWHQPSIWTELTRYGLERDLAVTCGASSPEHSFYAPALGKTEPLQSSSPLQTLADAFFSVDGHTSQTLLPFPYDPEHYPAPWKKYDHLSVRDRLDQMTDVAEEDLDALEHVIGGTTLVDPENCGFVHFLKWYALGGHSLEKMTEMTEWYRVGQGGMTRLARSILAGFKGDVLFNTVVREVKHGLGGGKVSIRCSEGTGSSPREISAQGLICTVPLNCLSDVDFSPAIPELCSDLIRSGHGNKGWKMHVKLSRTEAPWFVKCKARPQGIPWIDAVHDRNAPRIDASYAIAFGWTDVLPNPTVSSEAAEEVSRLYEEAFNRPGSDARVRAIFTHDWANDPMSRGAWVVCPPNLRRHCLETFRNTFADGHLIFASADWAEGGYSFVDGAIEQGKKAAQKMGSLCGSIRPGVQEQEINVSKKAAHLGSWPIARAHREPGVASVTQPAITC